MLKVIAKLMFLKRVLDKVKYSKLVYLIMLLIEHHDRIDEIITILENPPRSKNYAL